MKLYYIGGAALLLGLLFVLYRQGYLKLPNLSFMSASLKNAGKATAQQTEYRPDSQAQKQPSYPSLVWVNLPIKESTKTPNIATAVVQMYCNLMFSKGQNLGLSINKDTDGVMPLKVDGVFGTRTKKGMGIVNINSGNGINSTTISRIKRNLSDLGRIGFGGFPDLTNSSYSSYSDKAIFDILFSKLSALGNLVNYKKL